MAILVPANERIARLEDRVGRNDGLCSILTVVALLIVRRAISQGMGEETFLSAACVNGEVVGSSSHRNRERGDGDDIHQEA